MGGRKYGIYIQRERDFSFMYTEQHVSGYRFLRKMVSAKLGGIGVKIFLECGPTPCHYPHSAAGRQPVDSSLHSRAPFNREHRQEGRDGFTFQNRLH